MERIECTVIGAGVVGLSVARALAARGREVLILEAAAAIGTGISARNSEVIHAGIYYPTSSLKARLCVAGRQALYPYCAARGIAHRRCGKLIVASDDTQCAALQQLADKAAANGVDDLAWLDADAIRQREPALRAVAALHSPSTGIVDSHALMLSLLGDAQRDGAVLALKTPVVSGECTASGLKLHTPEMSIASRFVVNCAGLGAQPLAQRFAGLRAASIPPLHLAKGNYFALQGRTPFSHLIYPAPEAHGLGVHLTLDLAGQARFGPDVEWIEHEDYVVAPQRAAAFYAAIRRYWPALPEGALQPAYAGIRPKPHAPNEASRDFIVAGEASHGIAGLVNLFGIESPGLTASLALGDWVAGHLLDDQPLPFSSSPPRRANP